MHQLPIHNKEQSAMPQRRPPRSRASTTSYAILGILTGLSWVAYALYTGAISIPLMTTPTLHSTAVQPSMQSPILPDDADADAHSKNIVKLMDLPHSYLPQVGKHTHSPRLVVVGDVHGMRESLEELLHKVKFDKKHDHLILAGDMIAKGPDSKGVVDLALKLGATGIRGNHEDRVLLGYRKWRKLGEEDAGDEDGNDEVLLDSESEPEENQGELSADEVKAAGKRKKDRKLIRQLGKRRLKWLEQCPVILRVGKLGDMGEVVVVHAGLAPGVELKKQDPQLVMNMRTIKDGVPIEGREGTPWIKDWNKLQKSLPKHERTTVIYGHDSHKGLQVEKYSFGLDSGCVNGGKLTAIVIEGGHSKHTHKIVQVKCKDLRQ